MTRHRAPLELEWRARITDETIIGEIQRIAALVDGPIYRAKLFNAYARTCGSMIYKRFGSWPAALARAGLSHMSADRFFGPRRKGKSPSRVSEQSLIDHLKRIAGEKGSDTIRAGDLVRYGAPNPGTYARHFGSWRVAAAKAGLRDLPWGNRYTKGECIDNLRRVWMHLGRQPREAEMNRPPSTISDHCYQTHWRNWTGALQAFVAHVNADRGDTLWAVIRPLHGRTWPKPPPSREEQRAPRITLRYQVLKRDRFRCVLCGASPATDPACELHLDHIVPFREGGKTEAANLRTLCAACNLGRNAADRSASGRAAETAASGHDASASAPSSIPRHREAGERVAKA